MVPGCKDFVAHNFFPIFFITFIKLFGSSEEEVNDEEYRIILCFCTLPTIEQNNEIKLGMEYIWKF